MPTGRPNALPARRSAEPLGSSDGADERTRSPIRRAACVVSHPAAAGNCCDCDSWDSCQADTTTRTTNYHQAHLHWLDPYSTLEWLRRRMRATREAGLDSTRPERARAGPAWFGAARAALRWADAGARSDHFGLDRALYLNRRTIHLLAAASRAAMATTQAPPPARQAARPPRPMPPVVAQMALHRIPPIGASKSQRWSAHPARRRQSGPSATSCSWWTGRAAWPASVVKSRGAQAAPAAEAARMGATPGLGQIDPSASAVGAPLTP